MLTVSSNHIPGFARTVNTPLVTDGSLHRVLIDFFLLQRHLPDLSPTEA